MVTMNRIELIGHIGHPLDVHCSSDGRLTVRFHLATDRPSAPGTTPAADWHQVVCWGKLAEVAAQSVTTGHLVYVAGRLAYRSWLGTDGRTRHATEIIASDVLLLGRSSRDLPDEGTAEQVAS